MGLGYVCAPSVPTSPERMKRDWETLGGGGGEVTAQGTRSAGSGCAGDAWEMCAGEQKQAGK